MSYVTAMPELVTAAAADLAGIGSTIEGANAAAAGPTTNLLAAAEDEVSTAIAALFGHPCPRVSGPQRASGGLSQPVHAGPVHRCGLLQPHRGRQQLVLQYPA